MTVLGAVDGGGAAGVSIGDVHEYAEAVRGHLVGLSPEQVEDLTDDLEVDLSDALADEQRGDPTADLVARFGDPARYADELRTAAGLPVADRGPAVRRRGLLVRLEAADHRARRRAHALRERLRAQPWWSPVAEFLGALRPVGWVVRGWVIAVLLDRALLVENGPGTFLPTSFLGLVVLVGCVVLSVQAGRGVLGGRRWTRLLTRTATVVAVVCLLPLVGWLQAEARQVVYVEQGQGWPGEQMSDGVVVEGEQISNLFVFDAQGAPVPAAQVFDDKGRPVVTLPNGSYDEWWFAGGSEPWSFVGTTDADGRARWNVYPLQGAPSAEFTDENGAWVPAAGVEVRTPPWPFALAPALPGATSEPGDGSTDGEAADGTDPTDGTDPSGATDPADAVEPTAGTDPGGATDPRGTTGPSEGADGSVEGG